MLEHCQRALPCKATPPSTKHTCVTNDIQAKPCHLTLRSRLKLSALLTLPIPCKHLVRPPSQPLACPAAKSQQGRLGRPGAVQLPWLGTWRWWWLQLQ